MTWARWTSSDAAPPETLPNRWARGSNCGSRRGPPREPGPGRGPCPAHLQGVVRSKDVAQIRIDRIVADPDQPREEFDAESLDRLAESLKTRGQLQPIRVRWDEAAGPLRDRLRRAAMAGGGAGGAGRACRA